MLYNKHRTLSSTFSTNLIDVIDMSHSYLCTEQLISLHSLATYIAKRYISAARYTNVNGVVEINMIYMKVFYRASLSPPGRCPSRAASRGRLSRCTRRSGSRTWSSQRTGRAPCSAYDETKSRKGLRAITGREGGEGCFGSSVEVTAVLQKINN